MILFFLIAFFFGRYISNQVKSRLPGAKVVLDAFGGAGGNSIQFVYDFDKGEFSFIYLISFDSNIFFFKNSSLHGYQQGECGTCTP
jgi:hypothetical protein